MQQGLILNIVWIIMNFALQGKHTVQRIQEAIQRTLVTRTLDFFSRSNVIKGEAFRNLCFRLTHHVFRNVAVCQLKVQSSPQPVGRRSN